jgi:hypothetical protein
MFRSFNETQALTGLITRHKRTACLFNKLRVTELTLRLRGREVALLALSENPVFSLWNTEKHHQQIRLDKHLVFRGQRLCTDSKGRPLNVGFSSSTETLILNWKKRG